MTLFHNYTLNIKKKCYHKKYFATAIKTFFPSLPKNLKYTIIVHDKSVNPYLDGPLKWKGGWGYFFHRPSSR